MKKLTFIFIAAMAVTTIGAFAQTSNVMYSSSRIPQAGSLNPALFPSRSNFYIALPGANINFQSPLSYNGIFQYDAEAGQTNIDLNRIIDTLSDNGRINLDANIFVAGLGLKFGHTFITAGAQAKTSTHIGIPSGLLDFLNEGNYGHAGENMYLIDGNLLNAQGYTEYALGVGREIGKLTVGARVKLLNGYYDIRTSGTYLSLNTATDLSAISLSLGSQLQYSLPFNSETFDMSSFVMFPANWGYAIDLGARYEWSILEASLSVLDLGQGIHWKENLHQLTSANGESSFQFSGIELTSLISNGSIDSSVIGDLKDSILALTDLQSVEGTDYWTALPTKFNAGLMAKITPSIRAGVLFHGELDHNVATMAGLSDALQTSRFRSNTSLLANINIKDWVEVMGSISVVNDGSKTSWFNPGVGVNVSIFRAIQGYVMVDYISNLRLVDAKQFSLFAGLNIMLMNKGDND